MSTRALLRYILTMALWKRMVETREEEEESAEQAFCSLMMERLSSIFGEKGKERDRQVISWFVGETHK
jgi:hypothetical protein